MAITPDQQATLQLLLVRGQSYADLAKLLAVDESAIRARARAALTELGGIDPDRHVGLTDYLLGQADPIGRADASRHLREHAADHALATTLGERLRELFPGAELPRLPGEPRRGRRLRRAPAARDVAPGPAAPSRGGRGSGLSSSQTRLLVVLGSAALLLIAVVLALTGAFNGGGDDDSSAASGEPTTTASADDEEIERVALRPTEGGDARGEALFGLASGDQPFVELSIDGLDPAPGGQQYVVWLMLTQRQGYPLSPIAASQQGSFSNRFPIPSAVLPVVARVRFVEVAIAPAKEIRRVVERALEETSLVVDRPGRSVLRGEIPPAGGP
ncbi:MAG: Sigma-70 region 4 type 2 [Solirubrobacterales bacterium]|jgi:hypothetical protein|nr:Sigma-70 region 4 type 2 [Solirubrobacterales bacterium]